MPLSVDKVAHKRGCQASDPHLGLQDSGVVHQPTDLTCAIVSVVEI